MLILAPRISAKSIPTAEDLWDWVVCNDRREIQEGGVAGIADLRYTGAIILLLPLAAVRWHKVNLPPHRQSRRLAVLRAAVDGHTLLEEGEFAIFSAESGSRFGTQWVAVIDARWLAGVVSLLQAYGLGPSMVKPILGPGMHRCLAWAEGDTWLVGVANDDLYCLLPGLSLRHFTQQLEIERMVVPASLSGAIGASMPEVETDLRSHSEIMVEALESNVWDFSDPNGVSGGVLRRLWGGTLRAIADVRSSPDWRGFRLALVGLLLLALLSPPIVALVKSSAIDSIRSRQEALLRRVVPATTTILDPLAQISNYRKQLASARGFSTEADLLQVLEVIVSDFGCQVISFQGEDKRWVLQLAESCKMPKVVRRKDWTLTNKDNAWLLTFS